MKFNLLRLMAGALAGLAVAPVPRGFAAEPVNSAAAKTDAKKDDPLHLSPAQRAAIGLELAAPEKKSAPPEIEAYGRVLDPTAYVGLLADDATARASAAASDRELERVRKLYAAGGNASAQSVESAEAAAAKDHTQVTAAHLRLLAAWGARLAEADLAKVSDLLAQGAALLRIDLLPGSEPAAALKAATVSPLGSSESYQVEVLGPAPIADPQVQGLSYLALLRGHSLPAGATLRVALAGQGEAGDVLVLPRTSVVYHQGSAWVYVLGADDTFQRRRVQLDRNLGERVVVRQGVEAADQVVTRGAQQLLSSELQAGAGAGGD